MLTIDGVSNVLFAISANSDFNLNGKKFEKIFSSDLRTDLGNC